MFLIIFLTDLVVDTFQFSIRGAIVDFFPPTSELPIRVGFYEDDAILHRFDINTQITVQKLASFNVSTNSSGGDEVSLTTLFENKFDEFYLNENPIKNFKVTNKHNYYLIEVPINHDSQKQVNNLIFRNKNNNCCTVILSLIWINTS